MSSFEVLLFDTGACQWRCGRAEEQGPDVVLPGVAAGDTEAWQRQIKAALEQLEADPTECALILSEPPATTAAQRAERASFLFALGLQSVHFAAAPLLAIYDAGFDTGMVVDVGLRAAYIYALVDGLSVLEKATVVRLPSSGEERAWPDCEDHLPLLLDALVRTLALIDTSLREQLLSTIALAGGGSFAPELPRRLEQQLRDALKPAPWAVRIVAGAQRRFSCWLGGSLFSTIPSGEARFLSREEFAKDPAELHRRTAALGCLTIAEQEEQQAAATKEAAGEAAALRSRAALRARMEAEAAQEWWVAQAATGGTEERARMRRAQSVARDYYQSALAQLDLAPAPGPCAGPCAGARRVAPRTPPLPTGAKVWLGAACLEQLGRAPGALGDAGLGWLPTVCARLGVELGLESIWGHGAGSEAVLWRRYSHLLVAAWATSAANRIDAEAAAVLERHATAGQAHRGVRAWAAHRARRQRARARASAAMGSWRRRAQATALTLWAARRRETQQVTTKVTVLRRTLAQRSGLRRAAAHARSRHLAVRRATAADAACRGGAARSALHRWARARAARARAREQMRARTAVADRARSARLQAASVALWRAWLRERSVFAALKARSKSGSKLGKLRALRRWIAWAEWWHFRKVAAARFAAKRARSQEWSRSRPCGRALESIGAHAARRQQARLRLLTAAVAHRRRSQAAAVIRWVARRRDVGQGHGATSRAIALRRAHALRSGLRRASAHARGRLRLGQRARAVLAALARRRGLSALRRWVECASAAAGLASRDQAIRRLGPARVLRRWRQHRQARRAVARVAATAMQARARLRGAALRRALTVLAARARARQQWRGLAMVAACARRARMLAMAVARWLACLLDGNVKGALARRARAVHRLAKARAMRRWASRWMAQRAATRFRTTRFAPCLAAHVTHRRQVRDRTSAAVGAWRRRAQARAVEAWLAWQAELNAATTTAAALRRHVALHAGMRRAAAHARSRHQRRTRARAAQAACRRALARSAAWRWAAWARAAAALATSMLAVQRRALGRAVARWAHLRRQQRTALRVSSARRRARALATAVRRWRCWRRARARGRAVWARAASLGRSCGLRRGLRCLGAWARARYFASERAQAAEQLAAWLLSQRCGRALLLWLRHRRRRTKAIAMARTADWLRCTRAVDRWALFVHGAHALYAVTLTLSSALPRLARLRRARRQRRAWATLHRGWSVGRRLAVALPNMAQGRAHAALRRVLRALRVLAALRGAAGRMADRHRRERAVARWVIAVRSAHRARAAMRAAVEAYPRFRRALEAAALGRCWGRLRHACRCRLLRSRLLAKARLHHGKGFFKRAAVALARWAEEARRLLTRRRALQRERWYLDELRRRLDEAWRRCERQRSGAGVVTSGPQSELQRLLDLGIEAGAIQRLDADLSRPSRATALDLGVAVRAEPGLESWAARAVRIMRAGCRQRCEALAQALTPKMRSVAPALGPPLGVHSEQVLRGQSTTLGELTAQYHDVRCHLRRDPKVEVINAWRDVGRELVRLCQVQHAAASATKERVKSLLPRHPVATAALLRNPELTARFDSELFSLTVNELLPTLQGLLTTGGTRVAQVDMYTLTSTAASLTVTLNDPTLVQRLLWLPSSGFALWSAEAEEPHAPAGVAQLACVHKADMRYDFKDAVLRLRCELAYIPR